MSRPLYFRFCFSFSMIFLQEPLMALQLGDLLCVFPFAPFLFKEQVAPPCFLPEDD